MQFDELGLSEPLLRALRSEGYSLPTPIQELTIPDVLLGKDLLGCAQTGTGKTAAFSLPLLQRLAVRPADHTKGRVIRALILSPTRELAAQIHQSIRTYGQFTPVRSTVIYGGVNQKPQVISLRQGVDVLIATPGRLFDLMNQGMVNLRHVEVFVLDEADRMLDMGFIHDIRKVIAQLPAERQNLMFSATMPKEIRALANTILRNPVEVSVTPQTTAADNVQQTIYFVERANKQALLEHLLAAQGVTRALVFARTKRGVDRISRRLTQANITSEAIHSDRSQQARQRALQSFSRGQVTVLVASDIAARGLDVDNISHVFNYDMPNEPETYVHRIGRTGRAGATGLAVSFCDVEEREYLFGIERLLRKPLETVTDHPYTSQHPVSTGGHNGPVAGRGGQRRPAVRAAFVATRGHAQVHARVGGTKKPLSVGASAGTAVAHESSSTATRTHRPKRSLFGGSRRRRR